MKLYDQLEKTKIFGAVSVIEFTCHIHDHNPIHYDIEYCKGTIFKKPIVPGMLVASLFSGLLSKVDKGVIYLGQTLKFTNPVYIGEPVMAVIKLIKIREDKPILTFKTTCYKENGEIAIKGEAVIKI